MISDDKLIEMSHGVDNYISTLLMKYDITPLSLAAVLIARTMILNNEAGSSEDFVKLLQGIADNPPQMNDETKVH
jgi:hypothetical protein